MTPNTNGSFEPFSLYSMRQAIEERFIIDVLKNYTTYRTYWSLLKTIENDPHYDKDKASYLLKRFVDLHSHAIEKKTTIIVEHFADQVAHKVGGQAKAMIVTRSRLHAVRYKLAVDTYLKEHNFAFKALVAFTGTVRDPATGLEYTEARMNGHSERQTKEIFKRDEYRLLIVAEKFQTGFDQPLLHTMYVDKKLRGVHAVQTLSRLNRIHPGKEETMVLDFANETDEIFDAFAPYYEGTRLEGATDPNILYDLQNRLESYHFFMSYEVNRFAEIYFDPKASQGQLHGALEPVVDRFIDAPEDQQAAFRSDLRDYIRLYSFISQIITYDDADLERLYVFARLLRRKLPVSLNELPVEIQKNIEIDFYRIQQTHSGQIKLPRGQSEIPATRLSGTHVPPVDEEEVLSRIIKYLNEHFGTDFTEEDKVFIRQFQDRLSESSALENSIRVNTRENARLTFDHVAQDLMQDMIDANFKFYKRVTDDRDFAKVFYDFLFDRYLQDKDAA